MTSKWAWAGILLFSQVSIASESVDTLLGVYRGKGPEGKACYFEILPASLEDQDEVGLRFTTTDEDGVPSPRAWNLRGVRRDLETQLATDSNPIVLHHERKTWGDVNIHLTVSFDSKTGLPRSIQGGLNGLPGLEKVIDCHALKKVKR
jgi:hypothetical protein